MKQYFLKCIVCIGLLYLSINPALAKTEKFIFDPNHSFVTWHINHFGFSTPSGKWSFNGEVTLDEANPKNSNVIANININNPITGVPKLDEHLKKQDFFDVKKYPKATFVSNKVELIGKDQAKVYGNLTLHGTSKPVTLHVILHKIGIAEYSQKKTAGFSADTTIKRSDFGITQYLPGLSDNVTIQIVSEAIAE